MMLLRQRFIKCFTNGSDKCRMDCSFHCDVCTRLQAMYCTVQWKSLTSYAAATNSCKREQLFKLQLCFHTIH